MTAIVLQPLNTTGQPLTTKQKNSYSEPCLPNRDDMTCVVVTGGYDHVARKDVARCHITSLVFLSMAATLPHNNERSVRARCLDDLRVFELTDRTDLGRTQQRAGPTSKKALDKGRKTRTKNERRSGPFRSFKWRRRKKKKLPFERQQRRVRVF